MYPTIEKIKKFYFRYIGIIEIIQSQLPQRRWPRRIFKVLNGISKIFIAVAIIIAIMIFIDVYSNRSNDYSRVNWKRIIEMIISGVCVFGIGFLFAYFAESVIRKKYFREGDVFEYFIDCVMRQKFDYAIGVAHELTKTEGTTVPHYLACGFANLILAELSSGKDQKTQEYIENALESFNSAINLGCGVSSVFYFQGICLRLLKRYGEAVENFKKSLSLDSNNPCLHLHLAETLEIIGQEDKAKVHWIILRDKTKNNLVEWHGVNGMGSGLAS